MKTPRRQVARPHVLDQRTRLVLCELVQIMGALERQCVGIKRNPDAARRSVPAQYVRVLSKLAGEADEIVALDAAQLVPWDDRPKQPG